MQNQYRNLWLWALAILFFGFGDTFTSLMVFQRGGAEGNFLMGTVLALLGQTVWAFLLIKAAAMAGIVIIARYWSRAETVVGALTLIAGVFFVAQNTVVLMSQR